MIQLIVSTQALVNKQCLNIGANTKIKSLLKNNRYRRLSIPRLFFLVIMQCECFIFR